MFARSASTTRRARTPLRLLVVGLSLALAAAFGPPAAAADDPGHSGDAPYRGKVISLLRHMTLEQKVGQLFVIEVAGRDANTVSDAAKAVNQRLFGVDTPAQAIAKYQPGGVIYYTTRNNDDNIGNPAQVATLSNGLQTAALAQPARIPLQISVDQEGGALVARFGAAGDPDARQHGARRRPLSGRRPALGRGHRHRAGGRRHDAGLRAGLRRQRQPEQPGHRDPVHRGRPRSGVRPGRPRRSRGYHDGGVSAVAKHFPGHGDTGVDSHFGLPEVTHTLEQIHADRPAAVPARPSRAGVDSIMTAHVVMPAIDPGVPATMSHKILTGLLRDELGFDGLIVTDALDMAGATATYPPNVAPVEAMLAGADQLLVAPQMDTAYGAVLDAARSGEISSQRLDESVYRILLHKFRRGLFRDPFVDPAAAPQVVGAPQHLADAQAITDRTTTLVKNDAGLLPLASGPRNVLVAGWGVGTTQTMAAALAARGATTQVLESGTTPSATAIDHRRGVRAGCRPRRGLDQQRLRRRCDAPGSRPRPPPRRPGWCGRCWRPGSRSWSRRCATRTTSRRSPRRRPCSTPSATPPTRSSRWCACSSAR